MPYLFRIPQSHRYTYAYLRALVNTMGCNGPVVGGETDQHMMQGRKGKCCVPVVTLHSAGFLGFHSLSSHRCTDLST